MKFTQVTIGAVDYEKLANFYKKVFDFEEIVRYEKPELGLKAIKLSANGLVLEISQATENNEIPDFSYHSHGLQMIAIETKDCRSVIDRLQNNGGKLAEGPYAGKSVAFIAFAVDPEGNGIELVETHSGASQKIDITPWDRTNWWSTGNTSYDVDLLRKAASKNFWGYEIDKQTLRRGIQKLADSAGCPIPDKVADKLGESQSLLYFTSLIEDFNLIKHIANQRKVDWANQWGATSERLSSEPAGEDSDGIPEDIRDSGKMRGPGNYHEFMVTRLLWENKIYKNGLFLSIEDLTGLIVQAENVEDFHKIFLLKIGDVLFNNAEKEKAQEILLKGLCHEGYLRQNNNITITSKMVELINLEKNENVWVEELVNRSRNILESL